MIPDKSKIEEIIKELQKIMRIQDWDIFYYHCTNAEMLKYSGGADNLGYYSVNIRRNCADIYMDIEAKENQSDDDWYNTIVHELFHVATIGYRNRVLEMLPFINEDNRKDIERDSTDYYEGMVDNLTRMFCKLYPIGKFY